MTEITSKQIKGMIDDCGWSLYAVDSVRNRDVMLERESLCALLRNAIAALNVLKDLLELREGGKLVELPEPENALSETLYRSGMRLHYTISGGMYIDTVGKVTEYRSNIYKGAEG